jgi:23S rRNA (guanosine2251-2'-O)-methyltransferase
MVLIAHNLRSCHNVGSLLRTAEGLAVERVYLTGYTPYPPGPSDRRLPHLALAQHKQISKTALGAEKMVAWKQRTDIQPLLAELRREGYSIVALEQTPQSISLAEYVPPDRLALIVGREVEGLEDEVLAQASRCVAIPMLGQKESFNVVQAAAMALYHCRFMQ